MTTWDNGRKECKRRCCLQLAPSTQRTLSIGYRYLPVERTRENSPPRVPVALGSTHALDPWRKPIVGHCTLSPRVRFFPRSINKPDTTQLFPEILDKEPSSTLQRDSDFKYHRSLCTEISHRRPFSRLTLLTGGWFSFFSFSRILLHFRGFSAEDIVFAREFSNRCDFTEIYSICRSRCR